MLNHAAPMREQPPNVREQWSDAVAGQMAATRPGDQEVLRTMLSAALQDALSLDPDTFSAQREEIVAEMAQLLLPDLADDKRLERAAGNLTQQILGNDRFLPCLKVYAERVGGH